MNSADDNLMTVTEAAAVAERCDLTIRRWIEAGRLPVVRRFGRVLIRRPDLDRLLASMSQPRTAIAASAR